MAAKRRGSWTVTTLNGVVAFTVLILVAVLALVVKPPAPPGIAAFAPQANKPITEAPNSQSAQFGSGAGQCGAGQVCTRPSVTPKASPGAVAKAVVPPPALTGPLPPGLQCYQWPDGSITQTSDPQSPPCISRWDDSHGNGGATAQGVTGNLINVALPVTNSGSSWPALQPLVDYFNTRYQFYGRKIKVYPVHSQQSDQTTQGPWNDPTAQKADASAIAASKPFAAFDFLDPTSESGALPEYLNGLTKAHVISVSGGAVTPLETVAAMQKQAPYAWSYYPTTDELMRQVATVVCRQLVGKLAVHAPEADLQKKTRKFAFFLPTDTDLGGSMPGLNDALNILDGCGVHNPTVIRQTIGGAKNANEVANTRVEMTNLKHAGVTSVIFLPFGGNGSPGSPLEVAQGAGYQPEWVLVANYFYNAAFMLNDPSNETAGAFGVGAWNKFTDLALEPWSQAAAAQGATSTLGTLVNARTFYQELGLLAAGIQMAGPHLTPQTFAAALHRTTFPNPGAGAQPFYQGTVGFPGTSPIMIDDYTEIWLDTNTSGQNVQSSPASNEKQAFCEVALGRRWNADSWPTTDGFYQPGVCR